MVVLRTKRSVKGFMSVHTDFSDLCPLPGKPSGQNDFILKARFVCQVCVVLKVHSIWGMQDAFWMNCWTLFSHGLNIYVRNVKIFGWHGFLLFLWGGFKLHVQSNIFAFMCVQMQKGDQWGSSLWMVCITIQLFCWAQMKTRSTWEPGRIYSL